MHTTGVLGAGNGLHDVAYTMDSLDRLIRAQEGNWNGSSIDNQTRDEQWRDGSANGALSQTGNWEQHRLNLNNDGDFTDTDELDDDRTHNIVNELTARDTDDSGSDNYTLTHDASGNLTDDAQDYGWIDGRTPVGRTCPPPDPTPPSTPPHPHAPPASPPTPGARSCTSSAPSDGLAAGKVATVNAIKAARAAGWDAPTQYLTVAREEAAWVELRGALANQRVAAKHGEQPSNPRRPGHRAWLTPGGTPHPGTPPTM